VSLFCGDGKDFEGEQLRCSLGPHLPPRYLLQNHLKAEDLFAVAHFSHVALGYGPWLVASLESQVCFSVFGY
jgi:hypothetical protein